MRLCHSGNPRQKEAATPKTPRRRIGIASRNGIVVRVGGGLRTGLGCRDTSGRRRGVCYFSRSSVCKADTLRHECFDDLRRLRRYTATLVSTLVSPVRDVVHSSRTETRGRAENVVTLRSMLRFARIEKETLEMDTPFFPISFS